MQEYRNFTKKELIQKIVDLEQTVKKLSYKQFQDLDSKVDPYDKPLKAQSSELLEDFYKTGPFTSLRDFSNKINLPSGKVSEIFNGKRNLTLGMAEKISQSNYIEKDELREIKKQIEKEITSREEEKLKLKSALKTTTKETTSIGQNKAYLVSDWTHIAIPPLLGKKNIDSKKNKEWVSRELSIPVERAKESLDDLCNIGFISKDKNEYSSNLEVTNYVSLGEKDLSIEDKERNHKALINHLSSISFKTADLLKEPDFFDEKDKGGDFYNFAILADPNLVRIAAKMFRTYIYKVSQFLESGNKKSLYLVSGQLLNLEKSKTSKFH